MLDPVFSLRRRVRLDPQGRARISFVTGGADTREAATALAEHFRKFEAIEPAFAGARDGCRRELSGLAVRGGGGETAFYPLVENHHRAGMLRLSLAPAPGLTADLQRQAEDHARRVLQALNYVGVPRDKNNQISSFSNFARNLGGSVGTAMLTTFLQRTQQTHQQTLASHVVPGTAAYNAFMGATKNALMTLGHSADAATQMATGQAYQVMLRQASMLSYQNAFWVLSVIVACLIPLPFVMRKPPKLTGAPEEAMGH